MRFILTVTGPAYGTQQASSAYKFSQALIAAKHEIISIFFYREGVYNANLLTSPAIDEINLVRAWQKMHDQYGILLHICIAAALRRGIVNNEEAKKAGVPMANIQKGFILSSLGTLAEEILICDRLVQF